MLFSHGLKYLKTLVIFGLGMRGVGLSSHSLCVRVCKGVSACVSVTRPHLLVNVTIYVCAWSRVATNRVLHVLSDAYEDCWVLVLPSLLE